MSLAASGGRLSVMFICFTTFPDMRWENTLLMKRKQEDLSLYIQLFRFITVHQTSHWMIILYIITFSGRELWLKKKAVSLPLLWSNKGCFDVSWRHYLPHLLLIRSSLTWKRKGTVEESKRIVNSRSPWQHNTTIRNSIAKFFVWGPPFSSHSPPFLLFSTWLSFNFFNVFH